VLGRAGARERIAARTTAGPAPLSFVQERLWFFDQLVPGCPAYNSIRALRLTGPLNISGLQRSLDALVERQEALRTTFPVVDGYPAQVVNPAAAVSLPIHDLSALRADERAAALRAQMVEEARRPFDLANDLLLRASLVRLDAQEHVLMLVTHHIVFDAWSGGVVLRELTALYDGFAVGQPVRLTDLPIQYADYAIWQRERLDGMRLAAHLEYWKQQYADGLPVLQLPTDRPRPAVQTFTGARRSVRLPVALLAELKALSRREGATLFMTLLAAFKALLARYSGQEQIVVGSPIAGRTRIETEGIIGCFINTLAFNTNLAGDPSFRELLTRVRRGALGAYSHQELPFERLVEEVQPERDLSRTPVFQVMFQLRNVPRTSPRLAGLEVEELEVDPGIAKFDLTLEATQRQDGIECSCEYSTDLFEPTTIERFLGHYQTLLQGIIADPDLPLSRLPLLDAMEREHLLVAWNATARVIPRERCVHQLFEERAAHQPTAVAIRDGGREMTYGELDAEANRLAHRLRALGVGPEVAVGVCLERSIEFVVSVLAILKAGGAYVPLDPSHPQARLAFMLEDSQASVLLTLRPLRERLPMLLGGDSARVLCLDDPGPALASTPTEPLPYANRGDSLAYVIYTSGSTGKPKGVAITHRNIIRLVVNTDYVELRDEDIVAHASNCSFDAATFEIWGALLAGAKLVVVPREVALAPEELAGFLRRERVSTIFLTTALFNQVALTCPDAFRSVRHVLFGGEAVDPRPARLVLEHGAPERLLHVYGPTETTTYATWHLVREVPSDVASIPIGRPIANTRAYVLDRERQLVPVGVPGELYIGGDGVARGYLNRPELTAERFVPDPFTDAPDARLYRTGDLVRLLPDGSIEFVGRLDSQIKIRGYRIEPGEVEAVLAQHPAVMQAAVLVRADRPSERRLVAYVVAREGATLSLQTLRQDMAQRLPDYMVPAAFVPLDTLPVTPNGKLDRAALPAPDWSQRSAETFVAPRTATEEVLAQIWAEILACGPIGIHDDFFALGGHSLLATRVVVRAREVLDAALPLRAIFEAPTIATLGIRVEQARPQRQSGAGCPVVPLVPMASVAREADPPLSFTQERFWLLDQLTPGTAAYNVPMALRIEGCLDVGALEHCLSEIVRRHEPLRTTFRMGEDRPIQHIANNGPLALPVVELGALPEAVRMEEALALARREFQRPFDLARGPLLRAQLLRLDTMDHMLLLTIHHGVFDGWSMGVFNRELAALYVAFTNGRASPLAELPVRYADYAAWQRTQLDGAALDPFIAYWREQLAGAPHLLQLPTDRPRPAVRAFRGARHAFGVDHALAKRLRELSRQEGATLYMTLLAAFQTLLLRYTGQDDLLVGSPIAGRMRIETENLIGCFLNILVMRGDLGGDPSFRELLARVREVALGAYAHQELPFERLLEVVQPPREASYAPLVQVMFILQNAPRAALELPGLALRPLEIENGTTKYDLTLEITEIREGLSCSLQYDSDLFDAPTIARMAEHFRTLLAGIAADPDERLARLPLLPSDERARVLYEWNDTASPYSTETSLVALFEARVERSPQAIAFTCDGETLTYEQLNARANQLARYLRRAGVGPELVVGVCVERSLQLVVALLGILKAGGAYVPLDPAYPLDRLTYMLADSRAPILLAAERFLDRFQSTTARVVALDRDWPIIAAEPAENLADPTTWQEPNQLAYVLYTSGSTGQPKGAAVEHGQLLNRFAWMWQRYPFAPGEVGCQKTSINFVDSLWEIFGPLVQGVPSVIMPDHVLENPAELLETLAAARITRLWVVPSFLRALLESYPDLVERVPDLTFWAIGGEALAPELYQRFRAQMPGCTLINIYGASEFFDATYFDCQAELDAGDDVPDTIPIGRPLANMRAYVLDAQHQPTPIGVPGELYVGGVGLARGYLHRPELTAERFLADPFVADPHARLYRTGDLARWRANGDLEYLGRRDQQVKVRGYRIELGEIEAALARHAAVRQGVVVARGELPDARQLVAYVVLHEHHTQVPSGRELREFIAENLPAYMVPAAIVFLSELPLTPSGKVDRLALPAPERMQLADDGTGFDPPHGALEQKLAQLWEHLLGVSPIGAYDNFFDLGGHSLIAVRLFSQIEAVFGVRLSLSTLLHAPTVAQLGAILAGERASHGDGGLVVLQPSGEGLPLVLVHALGGNVIGYAELVRQLGPERPIYGLQARGFDGTTEPSTDIAEMATDYLAELRRAQPGGPYLLVGFSAGGIIAFEMARQLQEQGERVVLLGMLDTTSMSANQAVRKRWPPRAAWWLARDMPSYLVDYFTQRAMSERLQSLRRLWTVLKVVLKRKLTSAVDRFAARFAPGRMTDHRSSSGPPASPPSSASPAPRPSTVYFDAWIRERIASLPEHLGKVLDAQGQALHTYTPRPYSGHVTLFRAASQRFISSHEPDLGWGRLASSVTVHRVPGNHITMLLEPHVRNLAEQLRACVHEALTDSPSDPQGPGEDPRAASGEHAGDAAE
jgi:amino acid adenylation domain-containing protein